MCVSPRPSRSSFARTAPWLELNDASGALHCEAPVRLFHSAGLGTEHRRPSSDTKPSLAVRSGSAMPRWLCARGASTEPWQERQSVTRSSRPAARWFPSSWGRRCTVRVATVPTLPQRRQAKPSRRIAASRRRLQAAVARPDARLFSLRRRLSAHNFRNRVWATAVDTAGVAKPARLYDLRSTFASNALAAGITTFELARIMGTSVGMIEASPLRRSDRHSARVDPVRLDRPVGATG